MAKAKTGSTNADRTMSVQEAGRRGGQRVQELVHKGEKMENREDAKSSREQGGYHRAA